MNEPQFHKYNSLEKSVCATQVMTDHKKRQWPVMQEVRRCLFITTLPAKQTFENQLFKQDLVKGGSKAEAIQFCYRKSPVGCICNPNNLSSSPSILESKVFQQD